MARPARHAHAVIRTRASHPWAADDKALCSQGVKMNNRQRTILFLHIFLLAALSGCRTIRPENMASLMQKEYENYTLFYQESIPEKQVRDYDTITSNMHLYLKEKLKLSVEKPSFGVAVLPLENDVVDFQKRSTNACTDYRNIYLIDIYNLSEDLYEQYGEPPEGIANDAFSHELAHLFTHGVIRYSKKNMIRPEEMLSVCFSYIDFTSTSFELVDNISGVIRNNFSGDQMEQLKDKGLAAFRNAKDDRSMAVFLAFLHCMERFDDMVTFLEAGGVEDFMKKASWSHDDEQRFLDWLNEHRGS
jgi:hypothetical protein